MSPTSISGNRIPIRCREIFYTGLRIRDRRAGIFTEESGAIQRKATTYRVQFLQLILTERYRSREYTATREKERERGKEREGGREKGRKGNARQPRTVLHIIIPRSRYFILAVAASNEEIYALIAGTSRVNTRTQGVYYGSIVTQARNAVLATACKHRCAGARARARCCCIIVSLILASTKATAIKSILSRAQRE